MLYRATLFLLLVVMVLMAVPATAQEPNVTYNYHPQWQYPVLPTAAIPATFPITVPAILPGNSPSVYWNMVGWNNGAAATAVRVSGNINVDGQYVYWWITGSPINAGASYSAWDMGPINVRGGRHTLEAIHDYEDEISESNENDNVWAHQFVFTPYVLSESTPKTRGTPPDRLGGISSIVDGSVFHTNCDGFRFSSTGYWNAITMYATDNAEDYDLYLYAPSTGSENGFINSITGSASIEGWLDAVIVNRNNVGVADFDIGVTKYSGTNQFVIEQVVSTTTFVGDSMPITLGTDEYLRIWDTWIGDTGWVTVTVDDQGAEKETFKVAWIENDVTEIGLYEITGWEFGDDKGKALLHRNFTTPGWYGLVVYRDPRGGGFTKDVLIDIESTPPDLMPVADHSWHAPLVPSPVSGGATTLPDTLHGFTPETYFSFGALNFSPTGSPAVYVGIIQDDMDWAMTYQTPAISPFMTWLETNSTVGWEIPGGRHTLTLFVDNTQTIHEFEEDNNFWSEQFCWSPLELALGWQYSHFAPGPEFGGWETLDPSEPRFLNCDGYRLYTGYCSWEGMVLTQGPNSDYDLGLHHPLSGVKDGFDDPLAGSYYFAGETDYVLFNNNVLPAGVYDCGVENFDGDEPYTIEAVGSPNLPVPVSGHHGPYTMPLGNMLHLYNIFLEQDIYAFRLDNLIGLVDWGMALHPHDLPLMGRQDIMPGGEAWLNGPGYPEWFTVDVPAAGWYGLAVFKTGPFEFDKEGTYRLTIMQGVSDVPDEVDLPAATALAGVHPNPFNPQTTISYELAAAATVELEIFDVKGALVRRLVSGPMSAGRHGAVWNGEDDAGARVASGVYLVQFNAGVNHDVRKLVMLK